MVFGERIRALRKASGLTQRALAKQVGVDHTYISKMERIRLEHLPSENTIRRLASVLGASAYELLKLASKLPPGFKTIAAGNPPALELLQILSEQPLSEQTYRQMLALARAELANTHNEKEPL